MTARLSVFLDTSVIFAAILSPEGGSRLLFRLGEIGILEMIAGPGVLREADEVIRRKAASSLPDLAFLLKVAGVKIGEKPTAAEIAQTQLLVSYPPDVQVLAEALHAAPNWFVTLDRKHFLEKPALSTLPFRIGTPGDVIEVLKHL